jgi:hypothetical protein
VPVNKGEYVNRLLLAAMLSLPACAAGVGGMFGQGRTQLSVAGGNGHAFDKSYFVIGASVSYYVLDGLGVGLSLEKWSGEPGITKYAPFVQYVFYRSSSAMQPYIGAFYRRTMVDGLPGINSVGERAGINIISGQNAYINFGFVQEIYLDCQESVYQTCRETYPELGLTLGF